MTKKDLALRKKPNKINGHFQQQQDKQRDEFKRHDETEQSKAQRANVCTIN